MTLCVSASSQQWSRRQSRGRKRRINLMQLSDVPTARTYCTYPSLHSIIVLTLSKRLINLNAMRAMLQCLWCYLIANDCGRCPQWIHCSWRESWAEIKIIFSHAIEHNYTMNSNNFEFEAMRRKWQMRLRILQNRQRNWLNLCSRNPISNLTLNIADPLHVIIVSPK